MNNDPNTKPAVPQVPAPPAPPVKVGLAKEEDIVVELSPKDKLKKQMAFVAIGVLVLFIFLPFLLRLDPNYEPKMVEKLVEKKVRVDVLTCTFTTQNDLNKRDFQITSKYVDSKVVNSKFVYNFTDLSNNNAAELDKEEFDLEEYNKILLIKSKAITKLEQGNSFTVDVDYEKDPKIKNMSPLNKHNKDLTSQVKIYEKEQPLCQISKQPEVVIEKVILVEKG